jgi:hypothetical protein
MINLSVGFGLKIHIEMNKEISKSMMKDMKRTLLE